MEESLDKKGNKIIQTSNRSTITVLGGTGYVGMFYVSWPWLGLLGMVQPLFRCFNPVMVSKVTLLNYFNKNDYVGNTKQMAEILTQSEVITMETYLKMLFWTQDFASAEAMFSESVIPDSLAEKRI